MRRFSNLLLVAMFLGLVTAQFAGAQADDSTPADHPLVGAWLLDLGPEGGRLLTFHADGSVLFADADGTTGQGIWEATGDSTASFTTYRLISDQSEEDSSFIGYSILTGDITVDADSWTGDLAVAQTETDGLIAFFDGPFSLQATRLTVMPADQLTIGMPVAGLPPVATPAP